MSGQVDALSLVIKAELRLHCRCLTVQGRQLLSYSSIVTLGDQRIQQIE